MSEATSEPKAEPSLWITDPEEFGPMDIEGNPSTARDEPEEPNVRPEQADS